MKLDTAEAIRGLQFFPRFLTFWESGVRQPIFNPAGVALAPLAKVKFSPAKSMSFVARFSCAKSAKNYAALKNIFAECRPSHSPIFSPMATSALFRAAKFEVDISRNTKEYTYVHFHNTKNAMEA